MTKYDKVLEMIKEDGTLTNQEYSKKSSIRDKTIAIYISRMEKRGTIRIVEENGKRIIIPAEINYPDNFKGETLELMVEKFIEDFENALTYDERLEIGKMILRILERI